jgi:hypothetical protein
MSLGRIERVDGFDGRDNIFYNLVSWLLCSLLAWLGILIWFRVLLEF